MNKEEIKDIVIHNALYQEEIEYFDNLSKDQQKEILDYFENKINNIDNQRIKVLAKKLGTKLIAIGLGEKYLNDNELNDEDIYEFCQEREEWFDYGKRFFEMPDHNKAYNEYGNVLETNCCGEYQLSSQITTHLLNANGFRIDGESRDIKDRIDDLWDDKTEMIYPNTLDKKCTEKNGLKFKEFLFCEEYIKTGKITATSKNLGIGRTTCYDYLKKPEVYQYINKRRKEIANESKRRITDGYGDCFEELHNLFTNNRYQGTERIKAIDTYLKHYENIVLKNGDDSLGDEQFIKEGD